jgi:hypothetical protein
MKTFSPACPPFSKRRASHPCTYMLLYKHKTSRSFTHHFRAIMRFWQSKWEEMNRLKSMWAMGASHSLSCRYLLFTWKPRNKQYSIFQFTFIDNLIYILDNYDLYYLRLKESGGDSKQVLRQSTRSNKA